MTTVNLTNRVNPLPSDSEPEDLFDGIASF